MHYDDFTAHHDYELWLGNLLPELEANGLQGRRLLDVGCGTGKSFLPMLDRGWDVVAVDISPSMAAIAAEKAGGRARVEVADMRALPMLGDFDLVWCLDDAINYLLSASELRRCLAGLRRNLRPGGLCLFDVNCLSAYRGFFSETHVVPAGDRELVWRGRGRSDAEPGSESEACLEIVSSGQVLGRAIHRQRHFRPGEIEAGLAAEDLELLATYGHGTDAVLQQPLDEDVHSKAIFIAKRGEGR